VSRFARRITKFARALRGTRRPPTQVRRILVAHYLLLGDTLLLAPLLKALRQRYPIAQQFVLSRPSYLPLFEKRPYGVTALAYDRHDPASERAILRSGPYDLAFVPDDNRYAWLARAAGARWIVGFAGDRPAWKNWMLDEAMRYPPQPAAWADLCGALAGPAPIAPYRMGEWPAPDARPFPGPQGPYVVLHVGASSVLKRWPASRWRELADDFASQGLTIVWSGGAGEAGVLDAISMRPGEFDLIGKLDLPQLWMLLLGARQLVCPDTGVAHLGRLVGVPTVALFGPGSAVVHGAGQFFREALFAAVTDAQFPCRDQDILYRRKITWVRRCGRAFGSAPGQCPRASCMEAIEIEAVQSACRLQAVRQP